MHTTHPLPRPTVLVIGAGAAGTLTALHLARAAARRLVELDVTVLDPAARCGPGVAFGTPDPEHLLNVPASGMSALEDNPGHFVEWRRRQHPAVPTGPHDFAAREEIGRYLEQTLAASLAATGGSVRLRHLRRQALAVTRTRTGVAVSTGARQTLAGHALVLATGLPAAGAAWADEGLARSPFFVPDPWAPGALDVVRRDGAGPPGVLLVGSGLTTVDVVLSLSSAEAVRGHRVRPLHVVSRSGRLPQTHAAVPLPPAVPDVTSWGCRLDDVRVRAERHVEQVRAAVGDWRPAVDGLRLRAAELWQRLSEQDREQFLASDAGRWNNHRHRMAPASRQRLDDLLGDGRLSVARGAVVGAEPLQQGGLRVHLADGSSQEVGWVVNCTGPARDVRLLGNPVLDDLLRSRPIPALAVPATAGMGVRTVDGRVLDAAGTTDAPLWTLGALRRGELWESTALPEIRAQAAALAVDVLDEIAARPEARAVAGAAHGTVAS